MSEQQTDPQGPPEGWTPEDIQALEDADLISDLLYPKCATCPACGCPGMN